MGSALVIVIFLIIYFVPSFLGRHKKNALAIFILNLFFGWTFIGWVAALIWAVMYEQKDGEKVHKVDGS